MLHEARTWCPEAHVVVTRLLDVLLAPEKQLEIAIDYCGDEDTIEFSASRTIAELNLFACDYECIIVRRADSIEPPIGYITLIWENKDDVVSDYDYRLEPLIQELEAAS